MLEKFHTPTILSFISLNSDVNLDVKDLNVEKKKGIIKNKEHSLTISTLDNSYGVNLLNIVITHHELTKKAGNAIKQGKIDSSLIPSYISQMKYSI